MGKKKNKDKHKLIGGSVVRREEEESQAEESVEELESEANLTDFSTVSGTGGKILPVIYVLIICATVFLIWGAFDAVMNGTFSLPVVVTALIGGFIIAGLSRILQNSGYFQFYRFLSVLLLFLPAVMISTTSVLDGFLLGLLFMVAAVGLLTGLLPFFVKGIPVIKAVTYAGILLVVVFLGMLSWYNQRVVPHQSTVTWQKAYPVGAAFEESGGGMYVYGDTMLEDLQLGRVKDFRRFVIVREDHPLSMIQRRFAEIEENAKNISNRKKNDEKKDNGEKSDEKKDKKDKKAPVVPSNVIFEVEASRFSWSGDRVGSRVSVAAAGEKDGSNVVFVYDLSGRKRLDLITDGEREYFFPWQSRTFPVYTTWSPDGTKFFVFSRKEGEGDRVHVVSVSSGTVETVPVENAVSAYWSPDGELMVISGSVSNPTSFPKDVPIYGIDSFDFVPVDGVLYSWSGGDSSPSKVLDIRGETGMVKVHPLSGKMFIFDGSEVTIFTGKESVRKKFSGVPERVSSGFSWDGNRMVYLASRAGGGFSVKMADFSGNDVTDQVLEETNDIIKHVTFSGDGKYVLYTSSSLNAGMMLYKSVLRVYDTTAAKMDSVLPPYTTGGYRAIDTYPGVLPYAYVTDPHSGSIFQEQVRAREGFGLIREGVTLRMIYPPRLRGSSQGSDSLKPAVEATPSVSPESDVSKSSGGESNVSDEVVNP